MEARKKSFRNSRASPRATGRAPREAPQRHAVALCEPAGGDRAGPPRHSGPARSVEGCEAAAEAPPLFGFDFSFAPPIALAARICPAKPGSRQRRRPSGSMSTPTAKTQRRDAATFSRPATAAFYSAPPTAEARFPLTGLCEGRNKSMARKGLDRYDEIGAQGRKGARRHLRLLHR